MEIHLETKGIIIYLWRYLFMLEGNRRSRLWIGVVSLLLLVSLTACGLSEQTDTNKEKNEAFERRR